MLTRAQAFALTTRGDLLQSECEIIRDQQLTWQGRARQLQGVRTSGGSFADRVNIVNAMAKIESQWRVIQRGGHDANPN